MHISRKITAFAATAFSALILFGLLLFASGTALAGPPEPRELPALKQAPDIPVGSIILRRALPGHPAPPVEREFPGPDAPGLEDRAEPGGKNCDKNVDLTNAISGVVAVATQDNGICTNADIDTYVDALTGLDTYVVQGGGEEAAWTHTDVSDPANPVMVGQFIWDGPGGRSTYTPDIKAFRQGTEDYIVMGLERTKVNGFCGVVIYNVSDPANPVMESQYIGNTTNQNLGPAWCDTHNVFVETDSSGQGQYIYATADGPNDLRVLDISGAGGSSVSNPVEIGRYVAPGANTNNYVHDVTVLYHPALDNGVDDGRRVYLSYWDSGLITLKASDVKAGTSATPVGHVIDPEGFLTHHAWASEDGSVVFIQDEFLDAVDDEPVQMYRATDGGYIDGLVLGTDVPVNPAHNLEIRYDLDPDRLYVAWYKLGLQAWDFDTLGFFRPGTAPNTAAVYHQVQTEGSDDPYSGAWGVRLAWVNSLLYIFQSDRGFGLIVNCEGCTPPATGSISGTVSDSNGGAPISGASVMADTGQSTTTDGSGNYTLTDVPVGTRTVTASATGYVDGQATNVAVADGVTTTGVDIALDPEPVGGGVGTIKGTVTADAGGRLGGILVETDTGQSAITNNGGKYNIGNVPEGSRTVTASGAGYADQVKPATVAPGQTTTVDFALLP
jgi:hypothetical protein